MVEHGFEEPGVDSSILSPGTSPQKLRFSVAGGPLNKMFYYTYVLRSLKDRKLYVGWTNKLEYRIREHSSGKVESTKDRRPLKLLYYEACLIKRKEIEREKVLKTGFGRAYLKRRI